MIDLHSHILPGLDDGSPDLAMSLEMARLAVADGTTHMACTPHVMPGVYENATPNIAEAVQALELELHRAAIPLTLYVGADVHLAPDLPDRLRLGTVPTLNGSRYFLFEPPHHILPPRLEDFAARLIGAGFVPILTHPERLTWIKANYDVIERLNTLGCLIQLTADSVTGPLDVRRSTTRRSCWMRARWILSPPIRMAPAGAGQGFRRRLSPSRTGVGKMRLTTWQ